MATAINLYRKFYIKEDKLPRKPHAAISRVVFGAQQKAIAFDISKSEKGVCSLKLQRLSHPQKICGSPNVQCTPKYQRWGAIKGDFYGHHYWKILFKAFWTDWFIGKGSPWSGTTSGYRHTWGQFVGIVKVVPARVSWSELRALGLNLFTKNGELFQWRAQRTFSGRRRRRTTIRAMAILIVFVPCWGR